MSKATFLQLAHKYDKKKHFVFNWFLSEKLDGIRCLWDGGVTRGMKASDVPWANVAKDYRLKESVISTGLWSRYGHVIQAPDFFLDHLPLCPLDAELFAGRGNWQKLSSIVKSFDKSPRWQEVQFMVLDSPPLGVVFEDKVINETNYKKRFHNITGWLLERKQNLFINHQPFIFIYERLKAAGIENQFVKILDQIHLPMSKVEKYIEDELERIVSEGGEGVIIRNPAARYKTERSWDVLKYKPYLDSEGTVVGYQWGRETSLGSKLLGLMGSLIVFYNSAAFELSGFTDEERRMIYESSGEDAREMGEDYPGEMVCKGIINPRFPLGSRVTFRYRELSDRGIPKEAKYLRKDVGL